MKSKDSLAKKSASQLLPIFDRASVRTKKTKFSHEINLISREQKSDMHSSLNWQQNYKVIRSNYMMTIRRNQKDIAHGGVTKHGEQK